VLEANLRFSCDGVSSLEQGPLELGARLMRQCLRDDWSYLKSSSYLKLVIPLYVNRRWLL